MVNKIAFIIPTYPPHFNYAKNFLETFRKNSLNLQADLFFIFSDESEAQEFGEYEYKIILPDELRIFENGGIINIKKFFALKSLQNQYDYYIVLDSESEIIKNVDLYSICNSIYETKKLYGNTVWNFEHIGMCKIREQCKSHFKSNENFSTLAEKEKDLYLWFSNLPVYKNEFLQDFFVSIDFNNSISTLTGLDFDHYIYMYYLILYKNFKVVDLKMHGYLGAGENMPEGYCYIPANALKHDFYMCAKQSLHLWNNKNLFVVIQIDRILAGLFWIIGNALSDLTIQYHNLEERVRNLENKEIETKQKSKLYKFFHMYALRGKK